MKKTSFLIIIFFSIITFLNILFPPLINADYKARIVGHVLDRHEDPLGWRKQSIDDCSNQLTTMDLIELVNFGLNTSISWHDGDFWNYSPPKPPRLFYIEKDFQRESAGKNVTVKLNPPANCNRKCYEVYLFYLNNNSSVYKGPSDDPCTISFTIHGGKGYGLDFILAPNNPYPPQLIWPTPHPLPVDPNNPNPNFVTFVRTRRNTIQWQKRNPDDNNAFYPLRVHKIGNNWDPSGCSETNNTNGNFCKDDIPGNTFSYEVEAPADGLYRVWVDAADSSYTNWGSMFGDVDHGYFQIDTQGPSTPQIIYPGSNDPANPTQIIVPAGTTANVTIRWYPSTDQGIGVDKYHLRIDRRDNGWENNCDATQYEGDFCIDNIPHQNNVLEYSYSLNNLPANPQLYDVWVAATDKLGNWSDSQHKYFKIYPLFHDWFQVQGGDVYVANNLTSDIPPIDQAFNQKLLTSTYKTSAGVTYFGNNLNLGYSTPVKKINSGVFPANEILDYESIKKKFVNISNQSNPENPTQRTIDLANWQNSGTIDSPTVLEYEGINQLRVNATTPFSFTGINQLEVNATTPFSFRGYLIIFINNSSQLNNNVLIKDNIRVEPNSFLAIIVNGDINIDTSVTRIEGFYMADTITTGSSSNQLTLSGTFVARSGFNLQRSLTSKDNPAEIFTYRPDFLLTAPKELRRPFRYWEEVAP